MARPKLKPREPAIRAVEEKPPAKTTRAPKAAPPKKIASAPKPAAKAKRSPIEGTFQLTANLPLPVKQSIILALSKQENLNRSRADLVQEALNLVFVKYGVPVVETTTADLKMQGKE